MDGLPEFTSLWELTPWGVILGLIAYISLSIVRGWWVPKVTHERELQREQTRGDEWKETAKSVEQVNVEIRKQNGDLIEANKAVEQFLRAATPPGTFEDKKPNRGVT